DQTIQLWSVASGQRERGLDNHTGTIHDLAVQPSAGQAGSAPPLMATVSEDRSVRLWQPTIGRLVRFARLDSVPRCVQWGESVGKATDGRKTLIVGCDDGSVRVLDTDDMSIIQSISTPIRPIYELVIVPGGREVIVGGEGGSHRLSL
ncbi:MAG: WD40 repeat domain-containing protein, partial [Pirellulaceae bacterium]|nr:WD40 repeat domain-containing protein [Pirellulaceae bacterium]